MLSSPSPPTSPPPYRGLSAERLPLPPTCWRRAGGGQAYSFSCLFSFFSPQNNVHILTQHPHPVCLQSDFLSATHMLAAGGEATFYAALCMLRLSPAEEIAVPNQLQEMIFSGLGDMAQVSIQGIGCSVLICKWCISSFIWLPNQLQEVIISGLDDMAQGGVQTR